MWLYLHIQGLRGFPGDAAKHRQPCGVLHMLTKTHLPMQETQKMQVLSLGWEEPLEGEMATHPTFVAWRIPGTEKPGGLQSMGLQKSPA